MPLSQGSVRRCYAASSLTGMSCFQHSSLFAQSGSTFVLPSECILDRCFQFFLVAKNVVGSEVEAAQVLYLRRRSSGSGSTEIVPKD